MNLFKTMRNEFRNECLSSLLRELCYKYEDCHDCPAVTFNHRTKQFTCAQINILDQAKEKWGLKKEEYVTQSNEEKPDTTPPTSDVDICPECGKSNYRILQASTMINPGKLTNSCICEECGSAFRFVEEGV